MHAQYCFFDCCCLQADGRYTVIIVTGFGKTRYLHTKMKIEKCAIQLFKV